MDNFINAYNAKKANGDLPGHDYEMPFIGNPEMLSMPEKQELEYRYQYLHESVELLATLYRVTPKALSDYISQKGWERIFLKTEEEIAEFESHVLSVYKSVRSRMSGLVALHTARAWHQLASSETNLLASLERAAANLNKQSDPDPKTLTTLANAHNKMVDRHELIRNAIAVPAKKDIEGIVDGITKSLEDLLDEIDGTGYELPSKE